MPAPATPGELVFTDEQLVLLADLAGRTGFPGTRRPELDEAAWNAVAQGLAARGVIHDDDPSAEPRLPDIVLGVVLDADRWLWLTIVDGDEELHSRAEILWLKGELLIRQTAIPAGFHRFSRATVDELLDEALELPPPAGAPAGAPRSLSDDEAEQLLAEARRTTTIECGRRIGGSQIEGEARTFVETRAGELWLLGSDGDGSAMLEPITPDGAREQIGALAATLG